MARPTLRKKGRLAIRLLMSTCCYDYIHAPLDHINLLWWLPLEYAYSIIIIFFNIEKEFKLWQTPNNMVALN